MTTRTNGGDKEAAKLEIMERWAEGELSPDEAVDELMALNEDDDDE